MFVVRNAQIAAFRDPPAKFEAWMLDHLRTHLSAALGDRGDDELRRLIRSGISRTQALGAKTEAAACQLIDIMAVLGEGFDTDPAYPWASRILHDEGLGDAAARIRQLSLATLRHLVEQSEPNG